MSGSQQQKLSLIRLSVYYLSALRHPADGWHFYVIRLASRTSHRWLIILPINRPPSLLLPPLPTPPLLPSSSVPSAALSLRIRARQRGREHAAADRTGTSGKVTLGLSWAQTTFRGAVARFFNHSSHPSRKLQGLKDCVLSGDSANLSSHRVIADWTGSFCFKIFEAYIQLIILDVGHMYLLKSCKLKIYSLYMHNIV